MAREASRVTKVAFVVWLVQSHRYSHLQGTRRRPVKQKATHTHSATTVQCGLLLWCLLSPWLVAGQNPLPLNATYELQECGFIKSRTLVKCSENNVNEN